MIYTSDNEIYEDETAHALGVKHPSTVDYQDHMASRMAPPGPTEPAGALKSDPGSQVLDNSAQTKTITIVRHGATHLNNDTNNSVDKIRGWSDVPLTDEGRDQAHKAGDQLKAATIDSIHTSDLSRAHETAKIIGSYVGVDPTPTDKLRPWDLGNFTGKSTKDSLPKIQEYARDKPDEPVPGGESFNQFKARAFQGLSEAMQASDNPLIVTHHRTERLLKAWDKAGQPSNFNIHIPTFLQKGEDTGKVEQMKVKIPEKDPTKFNFDDVEPSDVDLFERLSSIPFELPKDLPKSTNIEERGPSDLNWAKVVKDVLTREIDLSIPHEHKGKLSKDAGLGDIPKRVQEAIDRTKLRKYGRGILAVEGEERFRRDFPDVADDIIKKNPYKPE